MTLALALHVRSTYIVRIYVNIGRAQRGIGFVS